MAFSLFDRVVETSTTTGTAAITLAAAVTGYRRFSSVYSVSDTMPYVIEGKDTNGNPNGEWEVGTGTYSSANTLTRTTVEASSNAGAAVNFSAGTKWVWVDASAAYLATAYRVGGTDVAVADGGTGSSTASGARTNLGLGTISTFDEGTAAQYRSNTSGKALSTDKVWSAADYVALTDAATVAVDMSTGINFSLTIGGNRTLGAPTNMKAGQTGCIVITQDGTGSRTLAYNAAWLFAGGTDPALSTAAGTKDVLFYQVLPGATTVYANLVKAIA